MACVILNSGMECSIETLTAFAVQELGKYKTPKVIKFVGELPKGPSGKVQRLKLLET
jgi:long-chain acyl-CoA synthetase